MAKLFPVLGSRTVKVMPWSLVEPWRRQVYRNHGQSLEELAKRGGLSPCELLAAATARPTFEVLREPALKAEEWLASLVAVGEPTLKPRSVWQHYRGGYYRLLHLATDAVTSAPVVIYESCVGGEVLVRPQADWLQYVEFEGGYVRRFSPR